MKTLYVHCGLHKTATTALQIALSRQADQLRTAGFLYPRSGRLAEFSGQHNIAWQITRDRRFDRQHGDLDSLFDEISSFDGKAIILSTEDFEGVLGHPTKWAPLLQRAHDFGLKTVLIVYLRNQISYLESLYQEMLKHGFGEEYATYAEAALLYGFLRLKEWEFQFDYSQIATSLSGLPGTELVFRNYHELEDGSIFADFLKTIRASHLLRGLWCDRINERDSVEQSLSNFYKNRVERELLPAELDAIRKLCDQDLGRLTTIGALRNAMSNKFLAANAAFCRHHHFPETGLCSTERSFLDQMRVSIDKVFSFETQVTLQEIAFLATSNNMCSNQSVSAEIEQRVQAWSFWIRS